jgi:hypothetical protein
MRVCFFADAEDGPAFFKVHNGYFLRKSQQILVVHFIKRRVVFQEIGYTLGNEVAHKWEF